MQIKHGMTVGEVIDQLSEFNPNSRFFDGEFVGYDGVTQIAPVCIEEDDTYCNEPRPVRVIMRQQTHREIMLENEVRSLREHIERIKRGEIDIQVGSVHYTPPEIHHQGNGR